jgi:hypothetical protein
MREQLRALDQHNPLVPLALGLLSLDRELDRLLVDQVDAETPALGPEDPTLALFLGIISLRRSFHRWLEHGCAAGDEETPAKPSPQERDVLRGLGR